MEGNKLYNSGQYRLALKKYQEALEKNGASKSGRYNLGLTQIRLGSNPADTTPQAKSLLQEGQKNLQAVAQLGGENPKAMWLSMRRIIRARCRIISSRSGLILPIMPPREISGSPS